MLYMNGTVVSSNSNGIIVENEGIGYAVKVASLQPFPVGEQTRIYVYKYCSVNSVKQDMVEEYYGFPLIDERELFAMLISVPGVGPKTAIAIMANGCEQIKTRIANRDIFGLQGLENIRPHVAVNLVDHLAHRFVKSKKPADLRLSKAAEALRSLGYRQRQIDEALSQVKDESGEVEQVIAESIKLIGQLSESERSKA